MAEIERNLLIKFDGRLASFSLILWWHLSPL